MDWFRWWHGSLTDPKFQWVARKSGQEFSRVIALWVALLEHASTVTQCNADVTRGNLFGFDVTDFDVLFDVDDGTCALIFAAFNEKRLIVDGAIANWEKRQIKRDDDSSKERVAEHRARKKLEDLEGKLRVIAEENALLKKSVTQCNADVTHGNAREEKIREEYLSNTYVLEVASQTDDALAQQSRPAIERATEDTAKSIEKHDCPHTEIISVYHEVLPMCPRIRDWTPARATQLRARWNEDKKRQNLNYWREFFEYVKKCDFLVGKVDGKVFFADLEWITRSKNFTKIREGKYENK